MKAPQTILEEIVATIKDAGEELDQEILEIVANIIELCRYYSFKPAHYYQLLSIYKKHQLG